MTSQGRTSLLAIAGSLALLLSACGGGGSGGTGSNSSSGTAIAPASAVTALFAPVLASGNPVMPFPFDWLFDGFTTPTLNIPSPPAGFADVNKIDGFSTTASIYADISSPVNFSTVPQNVVMVESGTNRLLRYGTDFTVDIEIATAPDPSSGISTPLSTQRSRLLISPLRPLAPATRYYVGLTNGLAADGLGKVGPAEEFAITSSTTPVAEQNDPLLATLSTAQLARLETLRAQYVLPAVQALNQYGNIAAGTLILAWGFTTQSIGTGLQQIAQHPPVGTIRSVKVFTTSNSIVTGLNYPGNGNANVYVGTFSLPYYMQVPSAANPAAPLSGFWQANPLLPSGGSFLGQVPCSSFASGGAVNGRSLQPSPTTTACFPTAVSTTQLTVPIILTAPNSAATGLNQPPAGWPLIIFQHGIGGNRENLFFVADLLAQAGFAAVAMDLPLHGVTDTSDPFYENSGVAANIPILGSLFIAPERTFDLDLENNSTGASGADGKIDPSGTWYNNVASLITSRDNSREAIADLLALTHTLKTVGTGGGPLIDSNRLYYFGHSLGAIVGVGVLGLDSEIGAAVLANPGGGLIKMIEASTTLGPVLTQLLASEGTPQGSDAFESAERLAQTIVDGADPDNFAAAARQAHAIDMIEAAGDQVVPNAALSTCPSMLPAGIGSAQDLVSACPAPGNKSQSVVIESGSLSGTKPLAAAMGLDTIGPISPPVAVADVVTGNSLGDVVIFNAGSHFSVITSVTGSTSVTQEMQGELTQFLSSNGNCLPVGGNCP